jgi:hypothetical protein
VRIDRGGRRRPDLPGLLTCGLLLAVAACDVHDPLALTPAFEGKTILVCKGTPIRFDLPGAEIVRAPDAAIVAAIAGVRGATMAAVGEGTTTVALQLPGRADPYEVTFAVGPVASDIDGPGQVGPGTHACPDRP